MAKKILVCDRCGAELTDQVDIEMALVGQHAWTTSARARGTEARGVIPCRNFVRCDGEMQITKK